MNNILIYSLRKIYVAVYSKNVSVCMAIVGILLALLVISCSASLDPYHDLTPDIDTVVVIKAMEGPHDLLPVEVNGENIYGNRWATLKEDEAEVIELSSGLIRFFVINEGIFTHDLNLVGMGIEAGTSNIGPRRTGQLEIYLAPGNYKIYCGIKNHRDGAIDRVISVKDGIDIQVSR